MGNKWRIILGFGTNNYKNGLRVQKRLQVSYLRCRVRIWPQSRCRSTRCDTGRFWVTWSFIDDRHSQKGDLMLDLFFTLRPTLSPFRPFVPLSHVLLPLPCLTPVFKGLILYSGIESERPPGLYRNTTDIIWCFYLFVYWVVEKSGQERELVLLLLRFLSHLLWSGECFTSWMYKESVSSLLSGWIREKEIKEDPTSEYERMNLRTIKVESWQRQGPVNSRMYMGRWSRAWKTRWSVNRYRGDSY